MQIKDTFTLGPFAVNEGSSVFNIGPLYKDVLVLIVIIRLLFTLLCGRILRTGLYAICVHMHHCIILLKMVSPYLSADYK